MYRAGLALLAGDIAGTIEHASRIFELAEPSDHFRLGGASALTGLAHWATGDLERRSAATRTPSSSFIAADYIPDVLGCSLALADIQLAQGRLNDAHADLRVGARLDAGSPGCAARPTCTSG